VRSGGVVYTNPPRTAPGLEEIEGPSDPTQHDIGDNAKILISPNDQHHQSDLNLDIRPIRKTQAMLKVEDALDIDIVAYLKEEYETKKRSARDISQDLTAKTGGHINISLHTVYAWLSNCNIHRRNPREAARLLSQDPIIREAKDELNERMRKRYANDPEYRLLILGNTRRASAQTDQAVLNAKVGDNPKETLKNHYLVQGLSRRRIAEMYLVSEKTVEKWFRTLRIPARKGTGAKLKSEAVDIFNRAKASGYLATLISRERQILENRYSKHMALGEIGKELGISGDRVKEIESKVLAKLTRQLHLASLPDK